MARNRQRRTVDDETGELARETASQAGGWFATLASAVALIFSGLSLYHSVLKQPELRLYVPPAIHYTRDSAINGEVFVLPVTVANHGARDGTVLNLRLDVAPVDGSEPPTTFESRFAVDEDYFVGPARLNISTRSFERVDRPRQPFAPISVAGHSSFTGTLLFYRSDGKAFPKLVSDPGTLRITLTAETVQDDSLGPLDRMMATPPSPITFVVKAGRADDSRLKRGATMVLTRQP